MFRRSSTFLAATVSSLAFFSAVCISFSDQIQKSAKNEDFAMRFDKTYEALIERLQAANRQTFGKRSTHRMDYREMLTEAASLAKDAGPDAALFLKTEVEDLVDKPDRGIGGVPGRYRLTILTLAKLESDDSLDILRNFLYREKTGLSTIIVISYLPRDQAKKLLEQVLQNPDRISESAVLESAVSLLAVIGDEQSKKVLRSLAGSEKRLTPNFLTKQLNTMQNRLAINSEKQRSERTNHELLYWQTQHDQINYRTIRARYFVAARRLHERKLILPVDLLLSKLPDPTAIAILGVQGEAAATPNLEKLAHRDGMIGTMAKDAIELIRETPVQ